MLERLKREDVETATVQDPFNPGDIVRGMGFDPKILETMAKKREKVAKCEQKLREVFEAEGSNRDKGVLYLAEIDLANLFANESLTSNDRVERIRAEQYFEDRFQAILKSLKKRPRSYKITNF